MHHQLMLHVLLLVDAKQLIRIGDDSVMTVGVQFGNATIPVMLEASV
jgi:hypothetical protein